MIGALKTRRHLRPPIFTGFRGPNAIRFPSRAIAAPKFWLTHHEVRGQVPARGWMPGSSASRGREQKPEGRRPRSAARGSGRETAHFPLRPALPRRPGCHHLHVRVDRPRPKGGTIAVNFPRRSVGRTSSTASIFGREDVFWPTGDPGWGYGFVCYLGALAAGGTIVCVQAKPYAGNRASPSWRGVTRSRALRRPPTLLRGLVALGEEGSAAPRRNLRVRAVSSCGEPLNPYVVEFFFRRVWNLTPMDHFGATEYALPIGNLQCARHDREGWFDGPYPHPAYRMANRRRGRPPSCPWAGLA